jgi:Phosphoesterase family
MFRKPLAIMSLPFILVGCIITIPTVTPSGPTQPPESYKPTVPHAPKVVLVILENKSANEVEDFMRANNSAFLSRLRQEGAYLSQYYAVAHPSQPNYVALISGSIGGVDGDAPARLERAHLGQALPSWMAYAEDYPTGGCDTSTTIGRYARKHVPFLSFADVQDDKDGICRQHITGFDGFLKNARDHALPSFSLVIPNLDHDAHDWDLKDADVWLGDQFSLLLDDAEFKREVILIVTFDETDAWWSYLTQADNRVYTALWGDQVIPNTTSDAVYDHYSLLRTIEVMFDLAPMSSGDKEASVIEGIWR